MNTTCRLLSRRVASQLGPRLTIAARHAHTASHITSKDQTLMRRIFTGTTLGVGAGVLYSASGSGSRVNHRFDKRNGDLDYSKWFGKGNDNPYWLGSKQ